MPELKCTVQTCTHNKNFYCDLDSIVVGGSSAKRSEETCCDSFAMQERLVQREAGHVVVKRQSVQHLHVIAHNQ